MRSALHAPTRRELLLASGVLFAWAYLPKLARAERRDPRFLLIVLRGALDIAGQILTPGHLGYLGTGLQELAIRVPRGAARDTLYTVTVSAGNRRAVATATAR